MCCSHRHVCTKINTNSLDITLWIKCAPVLIHVPYYVLYIDYCGFNLQNHQLYNIVVILMSQIIFYMIYGNFV